MKRQTRAQLSAAYSSDTFRTKLLDLVSLVAILRECIIGRSYRPTDELNNAILLTAAGTRVRQQLTTKEKVNPKDANILTLLALVHVEPLVDIENIDLDQLASTISDEIVSGALRYPLIFGRLLYDKAATLYPEERAYLNHEDTLRLLDGTPTGVFQSGHFLLGPFGIFRRPFARRIGPTTSIPLQHCADVACNVAHRLQLTTSFDAGVNQHRPALTKVLDDISPDPSEWNGFVKDFSDKFYNSFNTKNNAAIPYLLGDTLSDAELRTFVIHAFTECGKEMYEAANLFGLKGSPDKYCANLNRAQLLHLILMLNDDMIQVLLDAAVSSGVIQVPDGEIRRPRVNSQIRSGSWRLSPQLSCLGVRMVSTDGSLRLLQLSEIARTLFSVDSNSEMEDLAWTLRDIPGKTAFEQLESFLRAASPSEIVDRLVLSRKPNATRVCSELGIVQKPSDLDIRASILWKLGFPLSRPSDHRDRYWHLHHALESLVRTTAADVRATEDDLRSQSVNYFTSLERFLFDSLIFATWALLNDHYVDDDPFIFFADRAQEFCVKYFNENTSTLSERGLNDEPTLSVLVESFITLSKSLETLSQNASKYERTEEERPDFSKKTTLQKFPFNHRHPLLDLTPESQANIISTLGEVGKGLQNSGIMTARNGLLHAKQRVPSVQEVEESLIKAREALNKLESIGCVRSTYTVTSSTSNAWGGTTTTLESNGRTLSFVGPSAYEWAKLPSIGAPQYLMHGALFAYPNEMLRFFESYSSEYREYWRDYPKRPTLGNNVAENPNEMTAAPVETGSYASTRN